MKSEKGITLISLTIYIIALSIVIGIIATISGFFYKSMNINDIKSDPINEYVKFNSFFTDEINHKNIKVLECTTDSEKNDSYIIFDNDVQYAFIAENKSIYFNKIKICKEIDSCTFDYKEEPNGKKVITVEFKAGDVTRKNDYVITKY